MKVLSLFDGIACGRVALERAGIPVQEYHAFEVDKYAIQIAQKNYSDIVQHGDVFDGNFSKFKDFDLLLGGSPCTYWSIAKKGREITPDGIGGRLFMQYVRALRESGCKYFLYENNYSIHKDIKAYISKQLGVEPIMINSALVSAQNRKRCYWTNIPNVTQPEDKGILLKDVLENGIEINPLPQGYVTGIAKQVLGRKANADGTYTRVFEANKEQKANCFTRTMSRNLVAQPIRIGQIGKGGQAEQIYSVRGKSVSLKANGGGGGAQTGIYKIDLPDGDYIIRKLTPVEAERLQTLPDNYTEGISNTQRYKCIGNGWTVDVISHILGGIKK